MENRFIALAYVILVTILILVASTMDYEDRYAHATPQEVAYLQSIGEINR